MMARSEKAERQKIYLTPFLLLFLPFLLIMPAFGAVQGTLGTSSSGSLTITLVIPPRLATLRSSVNDTPAVLIGAGGRSDEVCISNRGLGRFSTAELPLRNASGSMTNRKLIMRRSAGTLHCMNSFAPSLPAGPASRYPKTILIAPE